MTATTTSTTRRVRFAAAGAGTLAAGLLTHTVGSGPVSGFAGDALYSVFAYILVAWAFPRASVVIPGGVALAFCTAIELLQLTPIPSRLSQSVPGAEFVFGSTFQGIDLVAYAVGVGVAVAVDATAQRGRWRKKQAV